MHGIELMQSEASGVSLVYSPITVFASHRINASKHAALTSSDWSRQLVTAFCSPATIASRKASITGSKLPACYFAPKPTASATRSALQLDNHAPGRARRWLLQCLWPVAASTTHSAHRASNLHSPPGTLLPSGSKRSVGLAVNRPAFRTRPISLRSPQPVSIASVSAADHRSRSATFPEACKSEAKRS